MSEFLAELLGTMVLVTFGVGVVGGVLLKWSKAEEAGWIVITVGWGLAVTMGIFVSGTVSDAHLNPAVTLGFASIGDFPWSKVPAYISGQMIGALIGATIVVLNYLPHWRETKDKAAKLGVFATAPGSSDKVRKPFQNLLSEVIGTFALLFALLFIVGPNDLADGLSPLIVGLLIVAIGVSLGGATGYAINPARDLGPRIIHALLPIPGKGTSDWGYAWIPVVGPIIGGVYGALLYQAFFDGVYSSAFWIVTIIVIAIIFGAVSDEKNFKEPVEADDVS
ncbi:MAG TPA: MIP/aquaporin family protein [Pseudogracilibacillus sp.]|nr:MIP/aquaporin family protein [Pseudogracilibacillus sp.]